MHFDKLTDEQKLKKLQNRRKNFGRELSAAKDRGEKSVIRQQMLLLDCDIKNLKSKIERKKKKAENPNIKDDICKKCEHKIEEERVEFFLENDGVPPDYCAKCQAKISGSFLSPKSLYQQNSGLTLSL